MPRPGPGRSASFQEIELRPAAGTIRLPLHRGGSATRAQKPAVVRGAYAPDGGSALVGAPRRWRTYERGAGWSTRPAGFDDAVEWDGYAEGEDICTRFGAIIPAGARTVVSVTESWGQPTWIGTFNGDLFVVFQNRIAYVPAGTGALTSLYTLAGDTFTNAMPFNGALRVANVCTHTGSGAGNNHGVVSITPSGASYTISHPDETYVGGPPPEMRWLDVVFWEHNGVGGFRLVGQTSDYQFRYLIEPAGDIYVEANWSAVTNVGDSTYQIRQLVASHDTVWFAKQDGLYAVDDSNANVGGINLTPYWKDQLDPDEAVIVKYWGSHVLAAHGLGIDLVNVNSWTEQDAPNPVHISHGRPNRTRLNGRYTAFTTDGNWLVAGLINTAGQGVVLYGTPRTREAATAAGNTLIDWFGPEVGPTSLAGLEITAMAVHTPEATLQPSLWIGARTPAGNPALRRVSLFRGSTPLADYDMGGAHTFSTTSSITLTDEQWGALAATKSAITGTIDVEGTGSGRKVDLYAAVGHGTAFSGTPSATFDDGTATETFRLSAVRGATVRIKLALTSTASRPVVVHGLELRADLAYALRDTFEYTCEISDATAGDLPAFEDSDTVMASLVALAESGETFTLYDDAGVSRTVILANVLPWRREERDDSEGKVLVTVLSFRSYD